MGLNEIFKQNIINNKQQNKIYLFIMYILILKRLITWKYFKRLLNDNVIKIFFWFIFDILISSFSLVLF